MMIRNAPQLPEVILKASAFNEVASTFHRKINQFLSKIFDIAYGKDLPLFFLVYIHMFKFSLRITNKFLKRNYLHTEQVELVTF